MSKSIEKIILDQAAGYAAKLATNGITVFCSGGDFTSTKATAQN